MPYTWYQTVNSKIDNVTCYFEGGKEVKAAEVNHDLPSMSQPVFKIPPEYITAQIKGYLEVKDIVINGPATTVFWADGTKTTVKCGAGEEFSNYEGFTAALAKKIFRSTHAVKKMIQRKVRVQKVKVKKQEKQND